MLRHFHDPSSVGQHFLLSKLSAPAGTDPIDRIGFYLQWHSIGQVRFSCSAKCYVPKRDIRTFA